MKILFILIAVLIIPGAFHGFIDGALQLLSADAVLIPLAVGFAVGLLLFFFAFRRWHAFTTFEHELTHAIIALLSLRKIKRFVSTAHDNGYLEFLCG
jgi:hypothetical protein